MRQSWNLGTVQSAKRQTHRKKLEQNKVPTSVCYNGFSCGEDWVQLNQMCILPIQLKVKKTIFLGFVQPVEKNAALVWFLSCNWLGSLQSQRQPRDTLFSKCDQWCQRHQKKQTAVAYRACTIVILWTQDKATHTHTHTLGIKNICADQSVCCSCFYSLFLQLLCCNMCRGPISHFHS